MAPFIAVRFRISTNQHRGIFNKTVLSRVLQIVSNGILALNNISFIYFFDKNFLINFDNEKNSNNKNVIIAALLIHAAKIDENYTDIEKKIIKKALINLNNISSDQTEELMEHAEKKEEESKKKNQ